jgi:hypothetical protein
MVPTEEELGDQADRNPAEGVWSTDRAGGEALRQQSLSTTVVEIEHAVCGVEGSSREIQYPSDDKLIFSGCGVVAIDGEGISTGWCRCADLEIERTRCAPKLSYSESNIRVPETGVPRRVNTPLTPMSRSIVAKTS